MPCTIYEHMFRQNPQLQPSNVTLPLLNVSWWYSWCGKGFSIVSIIYVTPWTWL
jgi:hypothetical protein